MFSGRARTAAEFCGFSRKDFDGCVAADQGPRALQGIDFAGKEYGAQGRNRTTDTMIFSHVLYQLSYLGTCGVSSGAWVAQYLRALRNSDAGL